MRDLQILTVACGKFDREAMLGIVAHPHAVAMAETVEHALEMLTKQKIDLVVLCGELSQHEQMALAGQAQRHGAAVLVCGERKHASSPGGKPMVFAADRKQFIAQARCLLQGAAQISGS
jgi:hypothetical protein